jgi:hypothetical protein
MFPGYSAIARHATSSGAAPQLSQASADPDSWIKSLTTAERACCCSAKPTTVAVLPPRPGHANQADLLLCNHHYRAAKAGLEKAGAEIHRQPATRRRERARRGAEFRCRGPWRP